MTHSAPEALRLLVVDDFPEIHELVETFLGNESIQFVGRCTTANRALSKAKDRTPDLVITDVWLHDMSGYRLAALLKRLNPKVKIIVTSAEDYKGDKMPFGVDAFILKDRLWEELPTTIRKLFPLRFRRSHAARTCGGRGLPCLTV